MGRRGDVVRVPEILYEVYTRRLQRQVERLALPAHVAVIMDGNRRWARSLGASSRVGHRRGAAKIQELLTWCEELGIGTVTLWMLSTDNLSRSPQELEPLIGIIGDAVEEIGAVGHRVHLMGATELLPAEAVARIRAVESSTGGADGLQVNVAIGYGGRREIVDAVRSLLQDAVAGGRDLADLARTVDADAIGAHLYTKGQPDPDLIIRTSGEQRLGGFLMWQSQHSEYYFCEAFWPGFRKLDFLRALRDYADRERRFGG